TPRHALSLHDALPIYLLHDRRLREADANDQIEISFCKRAHGRLDRVGCSWFDIAQDNRKIFGSTFDTFPGSSVERAVVQRCCLRSEEHTSELQSLRHL